MQEAREEAQIRAAPLTSERLEAKDAQLKEKREKEGKVEKWVMPKAVDGASIKVPKADVRVRIRRREGLPAGGFGMRRVG
ncbi:hypothetical protein HBI90_161390 [Parastagonospora nodorum]|nr:hypothetical protein HBI90_161390 [Parastagonospora nodorum]